MRATGGWVLARTRLWIFKPLTKRMLYLYDLMYNISRRLQYRFPSFYNIFGKSNVIGRGIQLRTRFYATRTLGGLLLAFRVIKSLQTTFTYTIIIRIPRGSSWQNVLLLLLMWRHKQNGRVRTTFCCSCWITPITYPLRVLTLKIRNYYEWMLVPVESLQLQVSATRVVGTATTWTGVLYYVGFHALFDLIDRCATPRQPVSMPYSDTERNMVFTLHHGHNLCVAWSQYGLWLKYGRYRIGHYFCIIIRMRTEFWNYSQSRMTIRTIVMEAYIASDSGTHVISRI